MTPTAASLLAAWEAGAGEPVSGRAPSLLRSLGVIADDEAIEELTIGDCDARLIALRRGLFGETLEVVAACPECGEEVEVTLSLADVQPPVGGRPVDPVALDAGGYRALCRLPRNRDLEELDADDEPGAIRALVARCAVRVRDHDGTEVAAMALPDAVVDDLAHELAERDPGAQIAMRIRCPDGHEWVEELNIRAVVWIDLTEWLGRTLTEVHRLAQAYGWSEAETLAMAPWRRRWYLEAVGW
jgi:hypothetical protein